MRAKVGVDRQREAEQAEEKKTKKTLGAIIPGSVLAAAVLFLFVYLFISKHFQYGFLQPVHGCNIGSQIDCVIRFQLFNRLWSS